MAYHFTAYRPALSTQMLLSGAILLMTLLQRCANTKDNPHATTQSNLTTHQSYLLLGIENRQ